MWKCPICETNNENQHSACIVCGHDRSSIMASAEPDDDIDFMEDICHTSSADNDSAAENKLGIGSRFLNFFFYVQSDDDDNDFDDDFDDDDFDDDDYDDDDYDDDDYDDDELDDVSGMRSSNAAYGTIIKLKTIFICALVSLAIFAVIYLCIFIVHTNDNTDIKFNISVKNAEQIDDILYMYNDPIIVNWSSNSNDARYNIELINDSGIAYLHYENTTITEISIIKEYFHTDGIHTLRITLNNGNNNITKEFYIKPKYSINPTPAYDEYDNADEDSSVG